MLESAEQIPQDSPEYLVAVFANFKHNTLRLEHLTNN